MDAKNAKTYLLSNDEPRQTDAGASGMAYTLGTKVTVFEEDGDFGYCYHGIGYGGNYYESEDNTGFASAREALTDAVEHHVEQELSQEDLDAWDAGVENPWLTTLRERIGFSHYMISLRFPGSVDVCW